MILIQFWGCFDYLDDDSTCFSDFYYINNDKIYNQETLQIGNKLIHIYTQQTSMCGFEYLKATVYSGCQRARYFRLRMIEKFRYCILELPATAEVAIIQGMFVH